MRVCVSTYVHYIEDILHEFSIVSFLAYGYIDLYRHITGPGGSRRLKLPYCKIIGTCRLSVLRTGRLYPLENILGNISVTDIVDLKTIARPERLG